MRDFAGVQLREIGLSLMFHLGPLQLGGLYLSLVEVGLILHPPNASVFQLLVLEVKESLIEALLAILLVLVSRPEFVVRL